MYDLALLAVIYSITYSDTFLQSVCTVLCGTWLIVQWFFERPVYVKSFIYNLIDWRLKCKGQ
jgi:hypothetical protein